jgi:hypothetical protein
MIFKLWSGWTHLSYICIIVLATLIIATLVAEKHVGDRNQLTSLKPKCVCWSSDIFYVSN